MKNQKIIFFFVIGLLILGTIATVFLKYSGYHIPSGKYDTFAQCLASKNLTMYGSIYCTHCQAEKARFGDSFQYVPYVECTENPNLCTEKGVEVVPTWIDQNGVKYKGEQGLEKLSTISGCELPTD